MRFKSDSSSFDEYRQCFHFLSRTQPDNQYINHANEKRLDAQLGGAIQVRRQTPASYQTRVLVPALRVDRPRPTRRNRLAGKGSRSKGGGDAGDDQLPRRRTGGIRAGRLFLAGRSRRNGRPVSKVGYRGDERPGAVATQGRHHLQLCGDQSSGARGHQPDPENQL